MSLESTETDSLALEEQQGVSSLEVEQAMAAASYSFYSSEGHLQQYNSSVSDPTQEDEGKSEFFNFAHRQPQRSNFGPQQLSQPQCISQRESHPTWQKAQSNSSKTNDPSMSTGVSKSSSKVPAIASIVDHTYRDFSGIKPSKEELREYARNRKKVVIGRSKGSKKPSANVQGRKANKNGTDLTGCMGTNFPSRLHGLLTQHSDIIRWLPHGRSWIVRDKERFLERVAPLYFQMSKYESFSRQVNGWGFKRITQGPDANAYYHELFLKGMPHLVKWMKRSSASSCGQIKRLRASPNDEPNFYEISAKYPIPDHYNMNGGKPVSMSLPLSRTRMEMPAVACYEPIKQMHPPRLNQMRRQGGYFQNDPQDYRSATDNRRHDVQMYPSKNKSLDHPNMLIGNSLREGPEKSYLPSSKRMRINSPNGAVVVDTVSNFFQNCIMLDECQHSNDQQDQGRHVSTLYQDMGIPHPHSYCKPDRNIETNISQPVKRKEEILPPTADHWHMFFDVISSDHEDDHIVQVSKGSRTDNDENENNDDDSFYRMITESVDFEDFSPSMVEF